MGVAEGRALGKDCLWCVWGAPVLICYHSSSPFQIIFINKDIFNQLTYSSTWEAEAVGLPLVW